MNSDRIWTLSILLFVSLSALSQIDSTKRDSIEEIIIYEYDTIYIQPDTIRITDTIFNDFKKDSLKVIKRNVLREVKPRRNPRGKGVLPKSIGFSVLPFIYLNQNTISDSLFSQLLVNVCYNFQINYYSRKSLFSIGIGYCPYHEQYNSSGISFLSSKDTTSLGSYDSLKINNNYQLDFYYDYLSFNLMVGRKVKLKKNFELRLNFGVSTDFLIGYKQGNTAVTNSMIRKINVSFYFSPQLNYRIGKNFEIELSPFYHHGILDETKYPRLLKKKVGIGVGFNFIL